ncbi:MAG: lanthionine synthetase LanC family protein [Telluria sp.]
MPWPAIDSRCDSLEERLVQAALARPSRVSLGSGMAGVMLAEARMVQLAPSATRADRVGRLAAAIAASLSRYPLHSGLWRGLAGVLYAIEFVRSLDPHLLGEQQQPLCEFVDEMDEVLYAMLAQRPSRGGFDLIDGCCGIGVYALVRTDRAAGARLFGAVEQALLDMAERGDRGCAWHVARDAGGRGHDLGVAHGTPGVIGLLGHALRLGIATRHSGALLDQAVHWLRAQEDPALPHSRFGSFTGQPAQSSRLGWCYGDLGIAAVLGTAAAARGDGALARWTDTLAAQRIAQPASTWQLGDDTLCHGRAGVLHILRRLMAHGWECAQAADLAAGLETALAHHLATASVPDAYGLLDGGAGVVLALAEAMLDAPPAPHPWHLCMLTPA